MRRGWLHLATGAGVGRASGFVGNLLLSRWLGPIDLGLFNLVTTTVQTSETLARCGGDYALNFELGAEPEPSTTEAGVELMRGFAQLCTLMTALICTVVVILVCFGQSLIPDSLIDGQRFIMTALLLLMIACEGTSASGWEALLVSRRTALLALRQGLFFPLRILFAASGALFFGVLGAMGGWTFIAVVQSIWLRRVLGYLWNPFQIWPFLTSRVRQLLNRGMPFYAANLLASVIFYPLLLKVATGSGLTEIGYLRVGQILQQLFAFLPSTLVPVLFLKLRTKASLTDQVLFMEKPLRIIWSILLGLLLLYCLVDKLVISWLFGSGFISAMLPTRLLLITSLFECLSQLTVQPLLAAGQTRLYGLWHNGAAVLAAFLGWLWIPAAGLAAYLVVRLLYVLVPLVGFGVPLFKKLYQPQKMLSLILTTTGLLALLLVQVANGKDFSWSPLALLLAFLTITIIHRQDLLSLSDALRTS